MRTYEETHSWLTFQVDFRPASHRLWMRLGEVQSKCEQIASILLQPATASKLHKVYLAKGALATTAIEGNTLSEEEAQQIVAGTLELPPSKQYLEQEIKNIVIAFDDLLEELSDGQIPSIDIERIMKFNRQVLDGLKLEEHVIPGEITKIQVGVLGYRGAPPEECEYLLQRYCDWLEQLEKEFDTVPAIASGLIKAILAHIYLVWIHPFGDGNGRTARLIESQILLKAGAPSSTTLLLSNHYNQTRMEYYRQLNKARERKHGLLGFIGYALDGFIDGLDTQLELIQEQQLNIAWRDYIRDQFSDKKGRGDLRRRQLIYELSRQAEGIPINKVVHVTPQVAETYAKLSKRTLLRDLARLQEMKMIKFDDQGIVANKEIMRTFLPLRMDTDSQE